MQPKGIIAKAALQGRNLQIIVESEQVPNQEKLVEFIRSGLVKLESPAINAVKVWGKQKGENNPKWSQEFSLPSVTASIQFNPVEANTAQKESKIEPATPTISQQSISQKPQASVDVVGMAQAQLSS